MPGQRPALIREPFGARVQQERFRRIGRKRIIIGIGLHDEVTRIDPERQRGAQQIVERRLERLVLRCGIRQAAVLDDIARDGEVRKLIRALAQRHDDARPCPERQKNRNEVPETEARENASGTEVRGEA